MMMNARVNNNVGVSNIILIASGLPLDLLHRLQHLQLLSSRHRRRSILERDEHSMPRLGQVVVRTDLTSHD